MRAGALKECVGEEDALPVLLEVRDAPIERRHRGVRIGRRGAARRREVDLRIARFTHVVIGDALHLRTRLAQPALRGREVARSLGETRAIDERDRPQLGIARRCDCNVHHRRGGSDVVGRRESHGALWRMVASLWRCRGADVRPPSR